jgi:phosphotransferase system HPr-like phosphotransfer protein|tara:strand:+ start:1469 stop:1963 length:495 start_codon:yes stop_codon:yes gene_type:complete
MGMQLVSTVTTTSGATSVTFSSIPADAQDLMVLISCKAASDLEINVNGSTSGYGQYSFAASAGNPFAQENPFGTTHWVYFALLENYNAQGFSNVRLYFPNYANTTRQKQATLEGSAEGFSTNAIMHIGGMRNTSTAAISSIRLDNSNNPITAKSTFSLYKLSAD